MKKFSLGFVAIALIMVLSLTITQVQAQENLGIQLDSLTGNRAGISGRVGIFNIDSNELVDISCQISSASGVGATMLLQRSSGLGWRPFFCPFTGGMVPVVGNYYWVTVYAVPNYPCMTNCIANYTQSHPLMSVGTPIYIG
ncbi:MAG: hypothetical protein ABSD41_05465 [Candidatus Bathyarchaeia archaeon]